MGVKFFSIQNTNIKLNNIKQYGISYIDEEEKRYITINSTNFYIIKAVEAVAMALSLTEKVIVRKHYLYIKTYQNDNFKFYGDEKKLKVKLSELEKLINSD